MDKIKLKKTHFRSFDLDFSLAEVKALSKNLLFIVVHFGHLTENGMVFAVTKWVCAKFAYLGNNVMFCLRHGNTKHREF